MQRHEFGNLDIARLSRVAHHTLICIDGSRHAPLKESIHLAMILEDASKYIVQGKWHARLPAPVPGLTFATSSPVL